jgi:peptidylprolyl isomerase
MKFLAKIAAAGLLLASVGFANADENTVVIETSQGRVVMQLRPDLAPKHAERIKTLAAEGFYNGIVFHRVIDGFMAQTGDPTGTGRGGSKLPDLPAEFSSAEFVRGAVGMARTPDPNSANSQFFIMLDAAPHLNGEYTVIGEVSEGMENVDKLKKGDKANGGMVEGPDKIITLTVGN